MRTLELAHRVVEALQAGDVAEAVGFCRSAIEDGDSRHPFVCGECGARFTFPGELDHHRFAHFHQQVA